jgi:hypothetical protein
VYDVGGVATSMTIEINIERTMTSRILMRLINGQQQQQLAVHHSLSPSPQHTPHHISHTPHHI